MPDIPVRAKWFGLAVACLGAGFAGLRLAFEAAVITEWHRFANPLEWLSFALLCAGLVLLVTAFTGSRWRQVAFTYNPNFIQGRVTRENGRPVSKPLFAIVYRPVTNETVLRLLLRHPGSVEVLGAQIKRGVMTVDKGWSEAVNPLKRRWRSTMIEISDHNFAPDEVLVLLIVQHNGELPRKRLKLFRAI